MNRHDPLWVPWRVRVRCAARAAWACLRADCTVQRIPVKPPTAVQPVIPPPAYRDPGMCRNLSDCVRTCHALEQTDAHLSELLGRAPR